MRWKTVNTLAVSELFKSQSRGAVRETKCLQARLSLGAALRVIEPLLTSLVKH